MRTHVFPYRLLTVMMLLALILPLSPSPSLLAKQEPQALPPILSDTISANWVRSDVSSLGRHTGTSVEKPRVEARASDTSSPAAITNLSASTSTFPGSVELSWSAPGDDATAGTASAYIVRYNTTTITESNWDMSTDVSGEPTMIVSGLMPGRMYYFAIKAQDEIPNVSTISNSASAVAQTYPNTSYLPLVLSGFSSVSTVIPETTEVLTEATIQYLSGISEDGAVLTFTQSSPALADLAPGDVIVGDATTSTPSGFLRKVVSVSSTAEYIVVDTGQATLEEAIESGAAQLNRRLTPDQVQAGTHLQGVRLAGASALGDDFYLELKDVVLYDDDGNPNTKHDRILANGSIRLKPLISISRWS